MPGAQDANPVTLAIISRSRMHAAAISTTPAAPISMPSRTWTVRLNGVVWISCGNPAR
jgi:hypothetical protein